MNVQHRCIILMLHAITTLHGDLLLHLNLRTIIGGSYREIGPIGDQVRNTKTVTIQL
jgi:hypothetical protein